ncbi:MAG: hypothetical protein KF861_18955 [Planctomycetaceae bacterium]|nr:hypothetical protein [Planctomycetaceae bacterium]
MRDLIADLTAEEMDPFLAFRGRAGNVFGEGADFLFGDRIVISTNMVPSWGSPGSKRWELSEHTRRGPFCASAPPRIGDHTRRIPSLRQIVEKRLKIL